MAAIGPDHWRVLSPYLDQALNISPGERTAWLESIREQNPALAMDLQTLLKEHHELGLEGFLQGEAALPSPAPLVGQRLGAYTLESPIGQGGMGTVWVARRSDGRFEGRAAVKFLNLALLGGAGEERFKREGNILARLSHPNIAHLIDAGVFATGQPYLILEYVEGSHIHSYCNDHGLDTEGRIDLFLDVLAAVAHAHANLIVHRDIKPSNVLVTEDGQVKLLDFGIAKLLEDGAPGGAPTVLTREGQRALTLAYAAPEQVTGGAITTGTDVYALGLLLYLLVAGKHPVESDLRSPARLMKAIVDTEPPRPSDIAAPTNKLKHALRGDLDTIVAKALKKNPLERYASVTALADDLRRYLKHEPISARPDTLAYRAGKFVRRNRTAVALSAAGLIATAIGVVGTVIQARTALAERNFALRQLSRAAATNDLISFVLSDAAPSSKPTTVNDLLARAEQLVERQRGADLAKRLELLISIGSQYVKLEELAKGRRLLEQAYTLARALPEPAARARSACMLANALLNPGELSRSEKLIQEGLNELPDDPRFALDRVFCLRSGSWVAFARGHSRDAVTRAQGAQQALSQSPFQTEELELENLLTLANAFRYAGQAREASAAFEEASARLTALGREDTQQAANLFGVWGITLWGWGRPLDAERLLRRAITHYRAEEDVSPFVLLNYARALQDLGRLGEAADYAERAHVKAQTLDIHVLVERAALARADIYRSQGDLERATQMVSELEPLLRRNFPPGDIAFASFALRQALNGQARGEMQTALGLANQAVAIAAQKDREVDNILPALLISRSDIQLQLGHPDEAAGDARRALKTLLDSAQPGTLSSTLGRAYLALGRALQAQGKPEESRSAFRSAVENLESALGPDHSETRNARQLTEEEIPLR